MADVVISDTPPPAPVHGMIWWRSDIGNSYIYYDDGNTQQWVSLSPAGPAGAEGKWVRLTQAEYDALSPPNPDILYIIVG